MLIIVNFIFFLSMCVNLYKVMWVINVPYNIFPWSPDGTLENSTPIGSIIHFIVFYIMSYGAKCWYLSTIKRSSDFSTKYSIMKLYHVMYVIGVIINIFILCNINRLLTFVINFITLAMLTASLFLCKPLIYILIFNIPIFVETVRLIFYIREILFFLE